MQTILKRAQELNCVTDARSRHSKVVSCFSGKFCFPPAWPKILSSWLAGCLAFYLVCCQLQLSLGIPWSLRWHVSISTLAGTDPADRLCKQRPTCNNCNVCRSRGKNPEKLGHQSCLCFHMVHYQITCLVWAQVTVLTLAHKGSARKGVCNTMQLLPPAASFLLLSLCTSSKRGIKSSTQLSNKINTWNLWTTCCWFKTFKQQQSSPKDKNVILILTSVLKIWEITNVELSKVLAAYPWAPLKARLKYCACPQWEHSQPSLLETLSSGSTDRCNSRQPFS